MLSLIHIIMCFSYHHNIILKQLQEVAQPPLVNILSESENQDIQNVLDGVCELVSFFELVSEAESGSTLHAILTAIVKDSCQWVSPFNQYMHIPMA